MNLPSANQQPPSNTNYSANDEQSINFLELLDILIVQRWVIAAVMAVVLTLSIGYAFLATPVYLVNTLIQVEESRGDPLKSSLAEASNLFDIKSPATAEIEILRSRLVVGQAVSNLQLDLTVTPKYLPLIGAWLAHGTQQVSQPGFLGLSGYVFGSESIKIGRFEVAPGLEDLEFSVVLTDSGYALRSPNGKLLTDGKFGQEIKFKVDDFSGEIMVLSAEGKTGAEFFISRHAHLEVTQKLQKIIKIVEQGKQSGVLMSTLEGTNPLKITAILNEIAALYVRQNIERKSAEAKKSLAFLDAQLPQIKAQLERAESRLNDFRQRHGTFDLDSEAKSMLDRVVTLKLKLIEANAKRDELTIRFTSKHPNVSAIDRQIKDLQSQIAELGKGFKNLPTTEQEIFRLTRDVKVNAQLYTNLLDSVQQLRLAKEGKIGNVRVVDTAALPVRPVKPAKDLVISLAAVLGLIAGIGLAFLRNSLHQGIKNADEIEHKLGLNVFATVPHSAKQREISHDQQSSEEHLLAVNSPNDLAIESLRSLRTTLQFAMLDADSNVLLITGATPGVGKSFTAANFSALLATSGKRVLLVDADMRKGTLHQYFGIERGLGLSDLMAGSQTFDFVKHQNIISNLDLLTTGTLPPNPAELLMTNAIRAFLASVKDAYDVVVIDSPPVLAVADTLVLAPLVGTIFLVARSEVTELGELLEASKRLSHASAKVSGVIFNGLDLNRHRYGYSYSYGYKRYGYRYQAYSYTNKPQ